mgnify:CR=1 FL=1
MFKHPVNLLSKAASRYNLTHKWHIVPQNVLCFHDSNVLSTGYFPFRKKCKLLFQGFTSSLGTEESAYASIAPKLDDYDEIEKNFFVDFNVQVRYDITHFASKVPFHIRIMQEKNVFFIPVTPKSFPMMKRRPVGISISFPFKKSTVQPLTRALLIRFCQKVADCLCITQYRGKCAFSFHIGIGLMDQHRLENLTRVTRHIKIFRVTMPLQSIKGGVRFKNTSMLLCSQLCVHYLFCVRPRINPKR